MLKALSILSDTTVKRSAVEWVLEIRKKNTIFEVIKEPIIFKFLKDLTNNKDELQGGGL